jgi:hypothetical protein
MAETSFEHSTDIESGLSAQFSGFAKNIKTLEASLAHEKSKNERLRLDWIKAQEQVTAKMKESQSRIRELTFAENRLKEKMQESDRIEADLRTKLAAIEESYASARLENGRYRNSWNELIQREKEAKMILADADQIKHALADAEKLNQLLQDSVHQEREARSKLERELKHRELEFGNAQARVHIAEGRAADKIREHQIELEKIRNSMEERMAQAKRENQELKKTLEHLRTERALDNERYARRIADERREREKITSEMQLDLSKHEAESERSRRYAVELEKRFKAQSNKGKKLLSRTRLRMQSNRKKLQFMTKMRDEERARNLAMSQFLVEEKQRLDAALEILLTLPTHDKEKLQTHIEVLRRTMQSGGNIALPAQDI